MAHAIAKTLEAFNERIERSMYPGGRPNRVARMLNRGWALVGRAGLGPNRLVTLEVRGRHSGRTISFPLVVADLEGERYLVAMLGERARWVENVRASGGRVVLHHGQRETVRLEEVEPGARSPILRRYVQVAPGGRAMIQIQADAPQAEFERIAPRYPVFRVEVDPVAQPVRQTPHLWIFNRLANPVVRRLVRSRPHRRLGRAVALPTSGGFVVRPIGVVRSTLRATADAPNQAFEGAPDALLEIEPPYADALHRVEPGDELIVLTWLHLARRQVLQTHPRGDESIPLTGVFRTRSPDRPNPIGVHRVTVTGLKSATTIRIDGLEAIDGTPIIDLKIALPHSREA